MNKNKEQGSTPFKEIYNLNKIQLNNTVTLSKTSLECRNYQFYLEYSKKLLPWVVLCHAKWYWQKSFDFLTKNDFSSNCKELLYHVYFDKPKEITTVDRYCLLIQTLNRRT